MNEVGQERAHLFYVFSNIKFIVQYHSKRWQKIYIFIMHSSKSISSPIVDDALAGCLGANTGTSHCVLGELQQYFCVYMDWVTTSVFVDTSHNHFIFRRCRNSKNMVSKFFRNVLFLDIVCYISFMHLNVLCRNK